MALLKRKVYMAHLHQFLLLPLLAVAACSGVSVAPQSSVARQSAVAPQSHHSLPSQAQSRRLPPINVRDYQIDTDSTLGDAPAINRAIQAAHKTGNLFVYLPPGVYHIRQQPGQRILDIPIRPEVDGLTLFGAPDGSSRIVLDADSFAILVNKGDTNPPQPVADLVVRDLMIDVASGRGLSNAGVVQINNAPRFHAVNVAIHADPHAQVQRGIKMDGLATSQGTTGLIERILIDGVSKTGLYLAGGTHHLMVKDCETMGVWNTAPLNAPPPGLGISDAHHITIVNHKSHKNRGDGLLIATNGRPPIRIPGLPDVAYGAYHPLNQANGPATHIHIIGGTFSSNGDVGGSGIRIASAYAEVPRDIVLFGVTVQDNQGAGIIVEAGQAIEIDSALVSGNGVQGILVRDVVLDGSDPKASRTSDVRIVNPYIADNGRKVNIDVSGLEVRGRVQDVGLTGGVIEAGGPQSRQRVGVSLVEENGRSYTSFFARGVARITAPIPFAATVTHQSP